MVNPVKQHTVPCDYLRGFSNIDQWRNSIVYIYDLKNEKWVYAPVNKITIIKDIYTLVSRDGSKSYKIEEFLWDHIDNIHTIIKKVDQKEVLELDELKKLSLFIAFQELRTTSKILNDSGVDQQMLQLLMRCCIENTDSEEELIASLQNTLNTYFPDCILECSISDAIEKFHSWAQIPLNAKNRNIIDMLELAPMLSNLLMMRPRIIFHAPPGRSYVTSDYPCYLHKDRESIYWTWYWTADTIQIPLSKKSFLIMYSPYDKKPWEIEPHLIKNQYQNVTDSQFIRMCNYAAVYWTERRLIWNNEALVKRIHKTIKKMDQDYKNKNTE